MVLSNDVQAIQRSLDRLVSTYGMWFSPSKYKVSLQDWGEPVPVLTLYGGQLELVSGF